MESLPFEALYYYLLDEHGCGYQGGAIVRYVADSIFVIDLARLSSHLAGVACGGLQQYLNVLHMVG